LLDSLVESLPTARVLLLVNYRPEYQHGWGSKTYYTQLRLEVVYLPNADKYRRLTRRPPKGQKVLDERALMASQRPFHSWGRPQNQPCGHTDPASAHGHPSLPLLRSLPHTPAGCGHGGTRKSSTSRRVQTWSVNPAAIAGV